jgi:hypothetical protein
MKTLYVASTPADAQDLRLDREITELQKRFGSGRSVQFMSLPDIKVEDLPGELSRYRPDVLHLAAHADAGSLALADEAGRSVKLTAELLHSFLPPDHPPQLVYLNACNSHGIAEGLVELGGVPMAIGSSAPITNRAARAAAVAFYERLLAGFSVKDSHEACRGMLEALADGAATAVLYVSSAIDASTAVFHEWPSMIADFTRKDARIEADGHYHLRLGIRGCPADATQVVFITDDASFITDVDELENDLTLVVRESPVNGVLWASDDYAFWRAEGDHRLSAVGLRAGGDVFALDGTLCGAIENRYRRSPIGTIPAAVKEALHVLRQGDGAMLEPAVWDARANRRKRARKARRPPAGKRRRKA